MPTVPESTTSTFASLLRRLSPKGAIWASETWRELVTGLAADWSRVNNRFRDLVDEADVRTTDEMVDAWERVYGLPDRCSSSPPTTLADRRLALAAKAAGVGGQSEQYLIDVAAAAGETITITTYTPFLFGVSEFGDLMYDAWWAFHFSVPESIPEWLQCQLDNLKPAHTTSDYA